MTPHPSTGAPLRASRIEARIAPDVLVAVKRAAEIQGRSVSDFVVAAARDAAERTIEETQILRMSLADQERMADTLAQPAKPNAAMKRAFAAHHSLIKSTE